MKQYLFNAFFLVYFIVMFTLYFSSCVTKKEAYTDTGTTEKAEKITTTNESEKQVEETQNNILTFTENETFSTDSEVIIFGDSGKYNTQTGDASGVKAVQKNKQEQKKENITNNNKTKQTTTNEKNSATADSTNISIDNKNITQEIETEIENYWYIWLVIGSVIALVFIIGLRLLIKSIL